MKTCDRDKTPKDRAIGLACTREKNHEGPCAMAPKKPGRWSRFLDEVGAAIGEAMFGGGR